MEPKRKDRDERDESDEKDEKEEREESEGEKAKKNREDKYQPSFCYPLSQFAPSGDVKGVVCPALDQADVIYVSDNHFKRGWCSKPGMFEYSLLLAI